MAIAVRVVFDELRRKRWRDVSLEALSGSGFEAQDRQEGNPEKAVTRKRVLNELRTALQDSLSAKQALALTAEMKGMPLSEIGARMSSNRNAIYKLTYDARKILKRVLSERGVTAETIAWAFAGEEEGAV